MLSTRPEFIADTMLKGLAKWLRFLGFSTAIAENFEAGQQLLKLNSSDIFITASPDHFRQMGEPAAILVKKNKISDQLLEIDAKLHIFTKIKLFSICSICNIPIQSISKEEVVARIPDMVKNNFNNFWICPGCQRIYWQGGHILRLIDKLVRMGIPLP
jgi:uncharacterized protein with PIN domain